MKTHIFYLVIGLLMINTLSGQVKIGDNPQTLHPASVLELESSTRALVITRVSNIEMNSITPLAGALVYNTDEDCLHYYNGTEWINICETLDNSFTVSTLALHNVTSQDSTVVITQEDTPDGINYNYEVNKIGSDNITNFSVLNSHIAVETITNDKIQNGTITNAKLDKLSIPLSGFGTPLTDVSMGNAARLTNLQNPTAPQDAATKSYVDNLADDDITAVTFNPANNRLTVNEGTTSFFTDLSPLEESADILANTTAINNHITADEDLSDINELSDISIDASNILTLSNPATPGNQVDLSAFVNDDTNELSDINVDASNILTLSTPATPGNQVALSAFVNDDTNELSDISVDASNILTLSNPATPGNQVDLSAFVNDDTNELSDISVDASNILTLSNPATPGNQVDLSAFVNDDTNELSDISVDASNILTLSNPATPGNQVDLSAFVNDDTNEL
ncbi:hypothetical protein ACPD8L_16295, partial [Flagellimonas sp. SN16]